jgi:hypothetical protein
MLYRAHLALAGFKLTTLVGIGTDCIGSCKSNYHTITATILSRGNETEFGWTYKNIVSFQKSSINGYN